MRRFAGIAGVAMVACAGGQVVAAPHAGSSDRLAPRAVSGPVASVEAWCAAQKGDNACLPVAAGDSAKATLAGAVAGVLGARLVITGSAEDKSAHLALQTAKGWYVTGALGDAGLYVVPLSIAAQPDAGSWVAAHWIETWNATDDASGNGRWQQRCAEKLVLCGVGASGSPSCTPGIEVRGGACDDPTQAVNWSWSVAVSLSGAGKLKLAAPGATGLTAGAKSALGSHTLALP